MESQFLEHFGEKEVVLINKEDLETDDSRDQGHRLLILEEKSGVQ